MEGANKHPHQRSAVAEPPPHSIHRACRTHKQHERLCVGTERLSVARLLSIVLVGYLFPNFKPKIASGRSTSRTILPSRATVRTSPRRSEPRHASLHPHAMHACAHAHTCWYVYGNVGCVLTAAAAPASLQSSRSQGLRVHASRQPVGR